MSVRSDVPPGTLGVDLREEGVVVQYLDGREVLYRGVPETVEGSLLTPPGRDVHVLVTDPTETEGVMVYVNDRMTHEDVLESTGVGRIILEGGEETTVFPGVTVRDAGYRVAVEADHGTVDGRVFVFAESEMDEHSYELVPSGDPGAEREGESEAGGERDEGWDETPTG